jgi:DNA-binding Xre family transcriptional regulator
MKLETIRAKLAHVNLTALAKKSGLSVRTLRRIKNDAGRTATLATVAILSKHLKT